VRAGHACHRDPALLCQSPHEFSRLPVTLTPRLEPPATGSLRLSHSGSAVRAWPGSHRLDVLSPRPFEGPGHPLELPRPPALQHPIAHRRDLLGVGLVAGILKRPGQLSQVGGDFAGDSSRVARGIEAERIEEDRLEGGQVLGEAREVLVGIGEGPAARTSAVQPVIRSPPLRGLASARPTL